MDILNHSILCCPDKHNVAAISYLINRLRAYPVSKQAKIQELKPIRMSLYNNITKTHTY